MLQQIPKSTFSTHNLASNKAYEAFRESIGVLFNVTHPSARGSDFSARLDSYLLGEVLLVDCMTKGQRFERTKQMIARDGMDHYLVQLFNHGHTRRTYGETDSIGRPNNIIIIDTSKPWEAKNSDFHNTTLVIPRRLMEQQLVHENDHHGRVIDVKNPFGTLLINYLSNLRQSIEHMSLQDAADATKIGIHLLSSALNRASNDGPNLANPICTQTFKNNIKRFIELNIADPNLSVDDIAARFRISRTHLYRLFDGDHGLANYIRTRRMNLALKKLITSVAQEKSIAQIAASVGYQNASAFTRAFRQHFLMSPNEARENCDLISRTNEVCSNNRLWEHWIQTL